MAQLASKGQLPAPMSRLYKDAATITGVYVASEREVDDYYISVKYETYYQAVRRQKSRSAKESVDIRISHVDGLLEPKRFAGNYMHYAKRLVGELLKVQTGGPKPVLSLQK